MSNKKSEEFNQIFVVSFLKKLQLMGYDYTAWHTPNGGSRGKAEAGRLKLAGVLAGVCDLAIMGLGKLIFIELKTNSGSTSKEQDVFIASAKRYGFPAYVVHGDHPKEILQQIGKIMALEFGVDQKDISSIISKLLASPMLAGGGGGVLKS